MGIRQKHLLFRISIYFQIVGLLVSCHKDNDSDYFKGSITDVNVVPEFLQKVVGKNLINKNDLLFGFTCFGSTRYIQSSTGIMSNKLYLSPGVYSLQGVRAFPMLTAFIVWFNDKDEIVRGDAISLNKATLTGQYRVDCSANFFYVAYARLVLQYNLSYLFNPDLAQFELNTKPTAFEECKIEVVNNPAYECAKGLCFLTGASNAMPGNGWFENACRSLGYKSRNVAISGENVMDAATKIWRGELYTPEELETIDIFCTSHTHNYNVAYENPSSSILCKTVEEYESKGYDKNNKPLTVPLNKNNQNHHIVPYGGSAASGLIVQNSVYNERYAAGYDYLLKKYAKDCYNLRFNPSSKWYGTTNGKPCIIVLCTYWHDAYVQFNDAIKELAEKHGAVVCDMASNIGFSYSQTDPADPNSVRQSALYCNNSSFGSGNDLEDIPINGVIYTGMGWHATRDVNSDLMVKRGNILADVIKKITF